MICQCSIHKVQFISVKPLHIFSLSALSQNIPLTFSFRKVKTMTHQEEIYTFIYFEHYYKAVFFKIITQQKGMKRI